MPMITSQQFADELLAEHRANRERKRLEEEQQQDLKIIRKCLERRS
jgi:hypothetical protein